ncbi:MAG: DNA-binding domain-containing protein [Myxococcaceae bacterium]
MRLASVQEVMFQAVTGEGALSETAALVRGGALTAEDRVGIYAEMYWLRMRDTLRGDFPLLHRFLGDDDFDVLVAKHVRRSPSTHYSLGRLGVGFAQTVRAAGPAEVPWLADFAELEWARAEAFVAADAPTLTIGALAELNDETFTHARLVASPSVRLLAPRWDVLPAWRALEADGDARSLQVDATTTPVVVWRQGFKVFHVALAAMEGHALRSVLQGLDLPTVCEAFAESAEPVQAAFQAIGSWVNEGMMSSLTVDAS